MSISKEIIEMLKEELQDACELTSYYKGLNDNTAFYYWLGREDSIRNILQKFEGLKQ